MSCLVAIFSVLVQWITCRTSYCKHLEEGNSFILLLWNMVLEGELFVTALEAQGLPVSWFITYFIYLLFSLMCWVLWHSLVQQPAGRPESPSSSRGSSSLSRGHAVHQDRLLPAVGKILKCPRFCSWPLACIFIKMFSMLFSIYMFCCLPVNIHASYLNFIEANSHVLHPLGTN